MTTYFWETETVSVSRAGTGWTVDVTAAQLDADLSIKDFRVLFAGVVQDNANFTKTTAQLITYTGLDYTGTVEVRRYTPTGVRNLVEYQERFSSLDYNRNLERVARQVGEFRALGLGGGTVLVNDGAYGALWAGDVSAAPSRASVYQQIEAMLNAQAIVDASQTAATNLRAPLASPTFTGIPLAPTAPSEDNSTQIATTAHVKSLGYATLASPALTGTPTAPTAGSSDNSTQVATTAFVTARNNRHMVYATMGVNSGDTNVNDWVNLTAGDTIDTDGIHSNGVITIPYTGYFEFGMQGRVSYSSGYDKMDAVIYALRVNGVNDSIRLAHVDDAGAGSGFSDFAIGTTVVRAFSSGNTIQPQIRVNSGASSRYDRGVFDYWFRPWNFP